MPNIRAAIWERPPIMPPNISAICAAVLEDYPDIGSALVDVLDGKTFDKEVDNENEVVVRVKLDGLSEGGANYAVTKIEIDVVSWRV